jgi:hypothetical protein
LPLGRTVTPTQLAWVAGLFDGEGSVGIDRLRPYRQSGERAVKYRLRLRVGMNHKPTIERLRAVMGGGSITSRKRRGRCADHHIWKADGANAYDVLRLIEPYLVTKASEALIGIEFFEFNERVSVPGRNGTAPEVIRRRAEFYDRLQGVRTAAKTYDFPHSGIWGKGSR